MPAGRSGSPRNPAKSSDRVESAAARGGGNGRPGRVIPTECGQRRRRSRRCAKRSTRARKTPESGGDVMGKKTVAELLVDTLVSREVSRMYGVAGDSLNGIIDAIRRQAQLRWVPVRHEETAAFAAGAEAHVTGQLAVCAGSCGPGNLHLINGLYDCHRSRVPVLAIAAQIPSSEIGSNYFQETNPQHLFAQCSHYCELVSDPARPTTTSGRLKKLETELCLPTSHITLGGSMPATSVQFTVAAHIMALLGFYRGKEIPSA